MWLLEVSWQLDCITFTRVDLWALRELLPSLGHEKLQLDARQNSTVLEMKRKVEKITWEQVLRLGKSSSRDFILADCIRFLIASKPGHQLEPLGYIDYPGSTRSLNWLKSIFLRDKDILILQSQYHGCWCPCDARSQGISRHGIDLNSQNIPPEGLTVWRVKS